MIWREASRRSRRLKSWTAISSARSSCPKSSVGPIDLLQDQQQAWAAADLLGILGIPDSQAIEALRTRARAGNQLNFDDTGALALLGDIDYVLALAKSPKTAGPAVQGIAYLTSCLASDSRRELPLDYRPIERLLDDPNLNTNAAKRVNDVTAIQITATDVDAALRGLESRHAAIRYHAVRLLGEPHPPPIDWQLPTSNMHEGGCLPR